MLSKSFYTFANFFLALAVFSALVSSSIHILMGQDIYSLPSFKSWYLAVGITTLTSSIFLIRYYYFKKYRYVFWTGTVAAIAYSGVVFVVFQTISLHKEFEQYIVPMTYFGLSASILYAFSLIFSNAGKQPRLKVAGSLSAISSIILLSSAIAFYSSDNLQFKILLEKINQWTSWLSGLIPILFILHFKSEERLISKENKQTSESNFSESWLGMAFVVSAGVILFLTFNMVTQSYGFNQVSARDKLLAISFEARAFVSKEGDKLQYRLLKPLNYDPKKKYPIVVCLHGGAGWGKDNVKQVAGSLMAQMLSEPANREKYPAFLFVPQCARGWSWGGLPNHKTIDELAFKTIDALEKEFSIDKSRRYVSGNSLGGYGAWHYLSVRPDMFAAAIPISGEGDPRFGRKIARVPVWAFHGDQDLNVPVSGSRNIINTMKFAGGKPKYTEYPNAGHDIWKSVTSTPGLLDWLFAQKRE